MAVAARRADGDVFEASTTVVAAVFVAGGVGAVVEVTAAVAVA